MGRLTTHVLDTANGCPGQGIAVTVFRKVGDEFRRQKFEDVDITRL